MMEERVLAYSDLDTPLRGHLCLDTGGGARPGLLLVHGGGGLDQHARDQARRYAELGYAVLACDMFGLPVSGGDAEGAGSDGSGGAADREREPTRERIIATVRGLRDDPDLLVRRGRAGLSALAQLPETDNRFGVVGFCFGGLAALTLARAGLELVAAVSMHGSLATVRPAEPGAVRAKLLVCHGARDPHVPMADVAGFSEEMIRAEADWRLTVYGNAVHGFTHAHAVPGQFPGVAYDRETDELSFAEAAGFLARAFAAARAENAADERL
jgi:dienelactone hydrolase